MIITCFNILDLLIPWDWIEDDLCDWFLIEQSNDQKYLLNIKYEDVVSKFENALISENKNSNLHLYSLICSAAYLSLTQVNLNIMNHSFLHNQEKLHFLLFVNIYIYKITSSALYLLFNLVRLILSSWKCLQMKPLHNFYKFYPERRSQFCQTRPRQYFSWYKNILHRNQSWI